MDYELKDIRTDIIEASQSVPVVLDFWAEWCGPCKALGPVLEKLADQAKGKWKLVKVDVEKPQNQSLATQFQIQGIPAVKMVYQGKLIAEFTGAQPEAAVRKWLSENIPATNGEESDEEEVDAFDKAVESGDRKRARLIAKEDYETDQNSDENKVKLALLLLPDDTETAKKLMDSVSDAGKFKLESEAVDTIVHIRELAKGKKKVDSETTKNCKPELIETYLDGCKKLIDEEFESAADTLIQVIMASRELDNDGARKACIALFKLLGEKHPVTLQFRRRFSMALY